MSCEPSAGWVHHTWFPGANPPGSLHLQYPFPQCTCFCPGDWRQFENSPSRHTWRIMSMLLLLRSMTLPHHVISFACLYRTATYHTINSPDALIGTRMRKALELAIEMQRGGLQETQLTAPCPCRIREHGFSSTSVFLSSILIHTIASTCCQSLIS